MRARSIAKTTGTGSRLAWDPTHAPSDKTRPVSTGGRQVEDGIHPKNRTTSADQNLWGGLQEAMKLVLTIPSQPRSKTRR
ncbi:hypothetical protein G6F33_014317 [Rhizopus arrhizus]|nr:hypothetical protein G6F33_014317 [Rhizopus arrhizus]